MIIHPSLKPNYFNGFAFRKEPYLTASWFSPNFVFHFKRANLDLRNQLQGASRIIFNTGINAKKFSSMNNQVRKTINQKAFTTKSAYTYGRIITAFKDL